jgi:hypothetical protein
MIVFVFLSFNKLDKQLIRNLFLFLFFAFSEMSDSESEPRLQQEESLHEVSPTPTQQDNSEKSLQIGS